MCLCVFAVRSATTTVVRPTFCQQEMLKLGGDFYAVGRRADEVAYVYYLGLGHIHMFLNAYAGRSVWSIDRYLGLPLRRLLMAGH